MENQRDKANQAEIFSINGTKPAALFNMNNISPERQLDRLHQQALSTISPATKRAHKADLAIWTDFCEKNNARAFPAEPSAIRDFVNGFVYNPERPKSLATIKRYIATLSYLHQDFDKDRQPTRNKHVRLAMKNAENTLGLKQKQARALKVGHLEHVTDLLERTIMEGQKAQSVRSIRDIALIWVAYDTMMRRGELSEMLQEQLYLEDDGSGIYDIKASKTDQGGKGKSLYISPSTVNYLSRWLDLLPEGAKHCFYRVLPNGKVCLDTPLSGQAIYNILRLHSKRAGIPDCLNVSGHSIRVGTTQDMVEANIAMPAIMQAGRWKSQAMPMRYAQHQMAKHSGTAKLAELQKRT